MSKVFCYRIICGFAFPICFNCIVQEISEDYMHKPLDLPTKVLIVNVGVKEGTSKGT